MTTALTCGRRLKKCRNCKHRYIAKGKPGSEYKLMKCPECGTDRKCTQRVKVKGKACRFHGGKSLKGLASPTFKTGLYSKYMPPVMAKANKETAGQSVGVDGETDLMRAMLATQIERLGELGLGGQWKKAQTAYEMSLRRQRAGRTEDFATYFMELGRILEAGQGLLEEEAHIIQSVESIRRLVDTQRQIRVDEHQMIATTWVLAMFTEILKGLQKNVLPLEGGAKALSATADTIEGFIGGVVYTGNQANDRAGSQIISAKTANR